MRATHHQEPAVPQPQGPQTPADEGQRLAELRRLSLLDTPPDEAFDRVTRLAAKALDVPIALVSLTDENRQWFKSRVGLPATQIPRVISFCGHAVFERQPLVVKDATEDPRFAGNPLVQSAPDIRAYLGIPLYTRSKQPIGTLCVIDTRPRDFGPAELAILTDFAEIIQDTIYARELAAFNELDPPSSRERERAFEDTFEYAAVAIAHTSLSGKMVRVNRRACELLGYSGNELGTLSFADITHPDDLPRNTQLFLQLAAGELDTYRMEKRFVRKDGLPVWTNLSVALRRSASGKPEYAIAVIEDISAQKQVEQEAVSARDRLAREVALQTEQLRERADAMRDHIRQLLDSERKHRKIERRLQSITNSIPAMIGYWNMDLHCEFANDAYRLMFGFSTEQMIGMHLKDLLGEKLFNLNWPHAKGALEGKAQRFQRSVVKLDGTPAHTEGQYLPDVDESGAVRGFYVLVTDISELTAAKGDLEVSNAKLLQESTTDFLTGIANRRVFSERSEAASARFHESGEGYGLILMDLDNFKQINDGFGHDVGDDVLRAVGKVLADQLRGREDLAARLGGEEFAVLCFGDFTEDSLQELAMRIRTQINKAVVNTLKGPVRFTSSFGIALCHPEDSGWKNIFARADAALYQAKATGKDRIHYGRSTGRGATGRFRSIRLVPNS